MEEQIFFVESWRGASRTPTRQAKQSRAGQAPVRVTTDPEHQQLVARTGAGQRVLPTPYSLLPTPFFFSYALRL